MSAKISGQKKVIADIKAVTDGLAAGSVSVGFLGRETYPDGTPVAAVAFWNEYGKMVNSKEGNYFQLPRPFFRKMISKESPTWGPKIADLLKSKTVKNDNVLGIIGKEIVGALQQSIQDMQTPPLAESTIKAKGSSKPLIDSGQMWGDVEFEVNVK
jgi:hypothetical protein